MAEYDYNNQGPRRSFKSRIILALIIAFMGWLAFMHKEENPVTKEMQHVSITPAEEVKLGLESAPQMAKEMGGELPDNDPRTIEVRKIGNLLVNNTLAKNSPWKFQFHLLADTETVNAFALPGGQIFITLGLYNDLHTEAQLAGVLAHEMGHVIERHSAQQMSTGQFGKILTVAVGTAASDNPNNSAYQIAAVVNQTVQLRYSRHDELEADTWGLKLMESVGYDPSAMIQVMEILKSASRTGGAGPDIFQTHPNPDLRIQQIKEYLKENPPPAHLSQGLELSHSFQ